MSCTPTIPSARVDETWDGTTRRARRRSSARAMSTTTTTRGARALANLFARCAAQASSACVAGPTTTTAGAVARGGAIASARAFDRRGARRDATRRDGDDGRGRVGEANLHDARSRRSRRSNASFVARDDDDDHGRTIDRWDGMGWGPPGSRTVEIPLETSPEGRRRTTERAGSTTRMNERWRSEK